MIFSIRVSAVDEQSLMSFFTYRHHGGISRCFPILLSTFRATGYMEPVSRMVWGRGRVSLFSIWIVNCPSSIWLKSRFSSCLFPTPSLSQILIFFLLPGLSIVICGLCVSSTQTTYCLIATALQQVSVSWTASLPTLSIFFRYPSYCATSYNHINFTITMLSSTKKLSALKHINLRRTDTLMINSNNL